MCRFPGQCSVVSQAYFSMLFVPACFPLASADGNPNLDAPQTQGRGMQVARTVSKQMSASQNPLIASSPSRSPGLDPPPTHAHPCSSDMNPPRNPSSTPPTPHTSQLALPPRMTSCSAIIQSDGSVRAHASQHPQLSSIRGQGAPPSSRSQTSSARRPDW